jgi:hypothetical protein
VGNKKGIKMTIKLGSIVKDIYTGFEGIAIGYCTHLYGCAQVGIEPTDLDKDGKVQETTWFDEQRVVVTKKQAPVISEGSTATIGGPHDVPPQRSGPNT